MSRATAGRILGPVNVGLFGLLVAGVAVGAVLAVRGPGPEMEAVRAAVRDHDAASAAAAREVEAFLRVDYRDMEPLIAAVLEGATGAFRTQYEATRADLTADARAARSVSAGVVRQVGVGELEGRSATLLVAADAVVRNKDTAEIEATKACPHRGAVCRRYRLEVDMVRTDDGWKMARLEAAS